MEGSYMHMELSVAEAERRLVQAQERDCELKGEMTAATARLEMMRDRMLASVEVSLAPSRRVPKTQDAIQAQIFSTQLMQSQLLQAQLIETQAHLLASSESMNMPRQKMQRLDPRSASSVPPMRESHSVQYLRQPTKKKSSTETS